jgi:hypothetical protein
MLEATAGAIWSNHTIRGIVGVVVAAPWLLLLALRRHHLGLRLLLLRRLWLLLLLLLLLLHLHECVQLLHLLGRQIRRRVGLHLSFCGFFCYW